MSKKQVATATLAGLVVMAAALLVARCVGEQRTVKITAAPAAQATPAPAPAASIAKPVPTEVVPVPAPKAKAKKKARKAKQPAKRQARGGFFAK